ncbi:MAG: RNA 2',3'-cyclic phosphodiesterase [Acidimicrobiaceae bacterium]|nr:RNA 2',3'-cyclic phosphodiesterase [Acidimicrobiaceae bacterium]MXZ99799.1 RNA 2',3'-cyclic phosphodiesterase [Acidimicrobiaceae bacterium]MYE76940.1 RNA 2',3'-cyclic phosphodiesterase [Acidimicrobiaceae bacterium]MYE96968.1 RNA 2',3'-cyclic phosphodiesterase [Acidimicrobiaceae bacterium]MYH42618.1 RNA 2',3'-cyclic phosphodiesterase [Acidimicrobiaceae bacterium]
MPRLFVAVWPPDEVLRELVAMPRPAVDGLRWTKPERLHVTLRFLGQCDEAEVQVALAAARLPAARVTLGPRPRLLGRGVLMVPVQGLDDLAVAVEAAISPVGLPPPDHPFTGHLTVARFKRKLPPGYRPALEASFAVTEIALVRTEPSGSYTNVERYTLA